jgi:hypothetical protein
MTVHSKHELKIADTDDDAADDSSNTVSPLSAARPDSTKSEPQPHCDVERERALEIDRVKRLNGVPRLALDTCRDDQ